MIDVIYGVKIGYLPDVKSSYGIYLILQGINSMSDYPVTFHYMSTENMYEMEYLVYHVRPYGIISQPQDLNTKVLYDQVEQNEIVSEKVDDNKNQQGGDNEIQQNDANVNQQVNDSDRKEVRIDINDRKKSNEMK